MAQPFPVRRAAIYRQRAQQLSEAAKQPRDECDRRHMLDQAATFQRAADAMAPQPPTSTEIFRSANEFVRPGQLNSRVSLKIAWR
jgi:hypothetical protein